MAIATPSFTRKFLKRNSTLGNDDSVGGNDITVVVKITTVISRLV